MLANTVLRCRAASVVTLGICKAAYKLMDTETFYCILKPGGVAVESPDASKWCIPRTFIERSPVLRSLITDVEEGSSFQLPAPEGYVQAWLRAVSKHSEDHGSVEEMGSGIIVCAHLLRFLSCCWCYSRIVPTLNHSEVVYSGDLHLKWSWQLLR